MLNFNNDMWVMKKHICIAMLLFCLGLSITSCACSPEAIAKKDAKEMNKAMDKRDSDAMDKAERHFEKHLSKYNNDQDKYFRYFNAYKEHLD